MGRHSHSAKSVQADCEIYISEGERREACGLMCNASNYSPTTKGHWYICRISMAEILSCPYAGLLMQAFPPRRVVSYFLLQIHSKAKKLEWNTPPTRLLVFFSTYDNRNCFLFSFTSFSYPAFANNHPDPTKTAEIVTSGITHVPTSYINAPHVNPLRIASPTTRERRGTIRSETEDDEQQCWRFRKCGHSA